MSEIDLMRHWGSRDYVGEVSDTDSDFGNGPLFTIQEGEEEDYEQQLSEEEDDEEVYDEEYGNENEETDDDNDDLQDDGGNVKTLFGDSDTETTVHDSTANSSTATMTNVTNNSLLQVSQPSHRMGSHNYIPASATASSTNGKYRTVSVFGGILDLADPTDGDGDDDSISSDGFSDDWSVEKEEEEVAQPKPRKAQTTSRQAPTERIEFKSEQTRDEVVDHVDDAKLKTTYEATSAVSPEAKEENDHHSSDQEKSSEPLVKQSLVSEVNKDSTPTTETKNLLLQESDRDDGALESIADIADIPKSIDFSLFKDKSLQERQRLQQSFLNELFFLPLHHHGKQE